MVEKHPDSQIEQATDNRFKEPSDAELVVFCICGHARSQHSKNPKCKICECKEFKVLV
jgi:hypothetical protein